MFYVAGLEQHFKGVMFDLDGTLIDSVPDLADSIDQMLVELSRPAAGEELVRTWVGNGASLLVERALAWSDVETQKAPEGSSQHPLYDEAFSRFIRIYEDGCCVRSQLYSGVVEALVRLKNAKVPMAVVTNKPILFTQLMLQHYDLEQFFICVVGGDSVAHKKPHPLPLEYAMTHLGTSADSTLMVGDSVTDIKAARAAQCPVVALPYGYNHGVDINTSGADLVIDTLLDLIEQ